MTALLVLAALPACSKRSTPAPGEDEAAALAQPAPPEPAPDTLRGLRAGFATAVRTTNLDGESPPPPPKDLFELVRFSAPLGSNAAYVTPARDGAKRPAIVWIHGGYDFGLSPFAWMEAPRDNDQSAAVFREQGLVLMLPSLRGTNDSPGASECFFGEVEDVIAAARYLATRPDVDPSRIYLGGHSTGATLALLVAESTDVFRGVFAFGPVLSVATYGEDFCLPDNADLAELKLRTPGLFLKDISSPTFVIEGDGGNGPYDVPTQFIEDAPVSFVIVPDANHFDIIRPGSEVVIEAIKADTGPTPNLAITAAAIKARMNAPKPR